MLDLWSECSRERCANTAPLLGGRVPLCVLARRAKKVSANPYFYDTTFPPLFIPNRQRIYNTPPKFSRGAWTRRDWIVLLPLLDCYS